MGCSRQQAWPVQRPWGRTGPGSWDKQQGGPCGWSRVGNWERGRGAGQGQASHAGPGDLEEDSSFDPKEVGAPGVCPREGMRLLYGNLEGQAERTARRHRPGG